MTISKLKAVSDRIVAYCSMIDSCEARIERARCLPYYTVFEKTEEQAMDINKNRAIIDRLQTRVNDLIDDMQNLKYEI